MEMNFVENQVEAQCLEQPDQSRISVLDDLQLALIGGGMGTVIVG